MNRGGARSRKTATKPKRRCATNKHLKRPSLSCKRKTECSWAQGKKRSFCRTRRNTRRH